MVVPDEDPLSSEAEQAPPESSAETDQEDLSTEEPPEARRAFKGDTPAVAKADNIERAVKTEQDTQEAERTKKRQNLLTRTLWSFIMIGVFLGLILMGHVYMIILVMLCQTLVYREVTALFSLKDVAPQSADIASKGRRDPWSKPLNWYFFAVTNYFLYGESIIYYFKHVVFSDGQLLPFATNHRIISFTLYTIGFMGFVMSLKRGYLKQQFGLFCWVHMSLLLIVLSSHFIVNNILEGLIWFFVPASLVICNDVFAYIWGITLGRTPLIKLSPKKTVEGFVGAFWSTLIFSVFWGSYFMRFNYMICPVHDLGVSVLSNVQCTPNPVFITKEWQIWAPLRLFLSELLGRSVTVVPYAPYQLHLLVFAIFASLVAPFGGFFASGFKRAFDIKDFGHSIPGHGGMTDRMDCQFLMGVFTYVYYSSLIREHHVTIGSILQMIVSGLTVEEQLQLMKDLRKYLQGQGVMTV
ncbi:cytidylyltransferase family-domain-containing protein [Melanogaster broomeanus]|nr:cytidylyltransferase family-domain-containing protein [Melanogaster broomeanus]